MKRQRENLMIVFGVAALILFSVFTIGKIVDWEHRDEFLFAGIAFFFAGLGVMLFGRFFR